MMDLPQRLASRRDMLRYTACGFGSLALAALAQQAQGAKAADPLAPRTPHVLPKAKRIIFLFMQGGPSQVDSFDYKPTLDKEDGKQHGFDDARIIPAGVHVGDGDGLLDQGAFVQAGIVVAAKLDLAAGLAIAGARKCRNSLAAAHVVGVAVRGG